MIGIKSWMKYILAAVTLALVACGGGSGNDSPNGDNNGGNGGNGGNGANITSYWTMDGYKYVNGFYSTHQSAQIGVQTRWISVISTANMSGGDANNGAYSGSALTITLVPAQSGNTYTVVPNALNMQPGQIYLTNTVGTSVTPLATDQYTASSGQVTATQGGDGKWHYTSVGGLPMGHTLGVKGTASGGVDSGGGSPNFFGIAGAPKTMTLKVFDAY